MSPPYMITSDESLQIPQFSEGYRLRPIELADYKRGALDVLKNLTTVGDISREEFSELVKTWQRNPEIYHTYVVMNPLDKVVAIGSIIIEAKLIHHCGKVGHIEDIAVNSSEQGKRLGLSLIRYLLALGRKNGCYKVILDCDPANEGFYLKCGLSRAGYEMEYRFI